MKHLANLEVTPPPPHTHMLTSHPVLRVGLSGLPRLATHNLAKEEWM